MHILIISIANPLIANKAKKFHDFDVSERSTVHNVANGNIELYVL